MSSERHDGTVPTMTALQAGHPSNHASVLQKGKETLPQCVLASFGAQAASSYSMGTKESF